MLDVLIRGGRVADGTGNPIHPADVALEGDRIVAVERLDGASAERVIDATGKIVCPGFVDVNGHSDWSMFSNPTFESTIRQGVTTEIAGNCGNGFAPATDASRPFIESRLREFAYEGEVAWTDFASYLKAVASLRPSSNLGFMVGHNTLRYAAGVERDPTEDQMVEMEGFVREAMDAGAYGFSSGLEFEPGRHSGTEELVRLAPVAGAQGGWHSSHIRNRDQFLQEAVEEFLTVVRRSGCRGELLHLNVRHRSGAADGAWERAVRTLEASRSAGLDVLTDTTPYPFGTGMMAAILPDWLFEGGVAGALERLRDRQVRRRLRGDCDRYWRFIHKGEWDRVRLQGSPDFPELNGLNFVEISEAWHQDPWDCYFDILAASGPRMESVQLIGTLFTEAHLAEMIAHPLFMLSADTFSSRAEGPLARVLQHPLPYAGHIHFLTHHVRARGTLRLEDAIRKLTSMPARHYGLPDRGLLRPGCAADVVVFDFEKLEDVSTMEKPAAYARGVEHVFVNGVAVVDGGEHTGARPGRILRRPPR